MSSSWTHVRGIFERAVALPDAERLGFVASECGSDSELQSRVNSMLRADAQPAPHLDSPVADLHLRVIEQEERRSLIGQVLDGFTLREQLGEGGTANVYLGTREGSGGEEYGAVKILRTTLASSGIADRFRQERIALSTLNHPGIVGVLGGGTLADGRPFLITEFVRGQEIDRHVQDLELGRSARLELFIQVCEAVHHAHSHLVVHRDLKSSNILIDANGQPRVLDFGIAKLLDSELDSGFTDVLGRGPLTLACASPEQVQGSPVAITSDVYSLGVLLYRMMTGASPYAAKSNERRELERSILEEEPLPPTVRARETGESDLPRDLTAILLCALRKRPQERYATALHFAEDIRRHLSNRTVHASRISPGASLIKLARRNPLNTAVTTAILFAGIGSWVGMRLSLDRVVASESLAWQAHSNAVHAIELMTNVLSDVGASGFLEHEELVKLLAGAESRLESEGTLPQEAEARLRQSLGRLYFEFGDNSRAQTHALRAATLARDTVGLGWRDLDRALSMLAEIAILESDPVAIEYCRERVSLMARRFDSGSVELLEAQSQLARALLLKQRKTTGSR